MRLARLFDDEQPEQGGEQTEENEEEIHNSLLEKAFVLTTCQVTYPIARKETRVSRHFSIIFVPAHGQGSDASGAVIPNADISVRDDDRHASFPVGEFKHLVELCWVFEHVDVGMPRVGLPGPRGVGSALFTVDDDRGHARPPYLMDRRPMYRKIRWNPSGGEGGASVISSRCPLGACEVLIPLMSRTSFAATQ